MTRKDGISRREAMEALKDHGIEGADVYLIDLIPLVEIMWADGCVQKGELLLLGDFLARHVERVNRVAGCQLLTLDRAKKFLLPLLKKRPDPALLRTLTDLVGPVRLASSDVDLNAEIRESLLSACLDIAAAEASPDSDQAVEHFSQEEKRCFFEILQTLECPEPPR